MPQHIIVGYLDTPGGRDALELGLRLADLDPGTELTVARVYLWHPPVDPAPRDTAERDLEAARELHGARPRTSFVAIGGASPTEGLHRLAEELGASTIVVGVSREQGVGRILAGSVTEQTLHGAPCAVAVAHAGLADTPTSLGGPIAIAYNGSPESRSALEVAADLARSASRGLRILGVVDEPPVWYGGYVGAAAGLDLDLQGILHDELEEVRAGVTVDGGPETTTEVLRGAPVAALASAAEDAALLVVGSRGYGPVLRTILGSVSSRLVRQPPCPLLVVPRTASAALRPAAPAAPGGASATD